MWYFETFLHKLIRRWSYFCQRKCDKKHMEAQTVPLVTRWWFNGWTTQLFAIKIKWACSKFPPGWAIKKSKPFLRLKNVWKLHINPSKRRNGICRPQQVPCDLHGVGPTGTYHPPQKFKKSCWPIWWGRGSHTTKYYRSSPKPIISHVRWSFAVMKPNLAIASHDSKPQRHKNSGLIPEKISRQKFGGGRGAHPEFIPYFGFTPETTQSNGCRLAMQLPKKSFQNFQNKPKYHKYSQTSYTSTLRIPQDHWNAGRRHPFHLSRFCRFKRLTASWRASFKKKQF